MTWPGPSQAGSNTAYILSSDEFDSLSLFLTILVRRALEHLRLALLGEDAKRESEQRQGEVVELCGSEPVSES